MTGNEYQELATRTNPGDAGCTKNLRATVDESTVSEYRDMPTYSAAMLINAALGLSGESGEVTDIVKKHVFHKHPLDVEGIKKELGDVMWYVAMCCTALNIEMDDVMHTNIEKLRNRYPEGFSPEASINRKE